MINISRRILSSLIDFFTTGNMECKKASRNEGAMLKQSLYETLSNMNSRFRKGALFPLSFK